MTPDDLRGSSEPLSFFIPVNPVPASRPRVTKWGTYYAKTYKNWMAEALKVTIEEPPAPQLSELLLGPLRVHLSFLVKKPITTKRDFPRGDLDNYEKAVLDHITKHCNVWVDDDQVVQLSSRKRFATSNEKPGILVMVWSLNVNPV